MIEDDPMFLSDEEREAIFHEKEKTPGIPPAEAMRRVIGNERAARFRDAETAAKRQTSASSKPIRPYRARYKDSTDHSVAAFKQVTKGQVEVSEEEVEAGRESQAFIGRVLEETGSFDLPKYLQSHPEKTEEARQLGLVE